MSDYTSQNRDRGECPVCGRSFEITKRGALRHHSGPARTDDGGWTHAYRCGGAGQPPTTP